MYKHISLSLTLQHITFCVVPRRRWRYIPRFSNLHFDESVFLNTIGKIRLLRKLLHFLRASIHHKPGERLVPHKMNIHFAQVWYERWKKQQNWKKNVNKKFSTHHFQGMPKKTAEKSSWARKIYVVNKTVEMVVGEFLHFPPGKSDYINHPHNNGGTQHVLALCRFLEWRMHPGSVLCVVLVHEIKEYGKSAVSVVIESSLFRLFYWTCSFKRRLSRKLWKEED